MDDVLFVVALVLLVLGLGIKIYGMVQLANKNLSEAERMARYKKTLPISYILLLPTVVIVIYLLVTK